MHTRIPELHGEDLTRSMGMFAVWWIETFFRVGRGGGVIAAGGHGSEHHNAGQSGNGANEDVLLHDYYLIPLSTIRGRLSAARSIHDNYKRIGGFKGPKPKSVNRR